MNGDGLQIVIGLACFFIPLFMGWIIGGTVERSHFSNLSLREDSLRSQMIVTQNKRCFAPIGGQAPPTILTAEVCIATDYLKTYLSSWRSFFGGEMRSYQTLLERARREAIMRLVEDAHAKGYNAVGNIRLQPCEIGGKAAMAVIIATGTAYYSALPVVDEHSFNEQGAPTAPLDETGNPYQPGGEHQG